MGDEDDLLLVGLAWSMLQEQPKEEEPRKKSDDGPKPWRPVAGGGRLAAHLMEDGAVMLLEDGAVMLLE